VSPAPGARLTDDGRIRVAHARPGIVSVDGKSWAVASHGRTPRQILDGAGVALSPGDRVTVNGEAWPVDRPLGFRRRVVQLAGGLSRSIPVPDELPAEAMAGEAAAPADPADATLTDGGWQVAVQRALAVTIVEDGVPYSTHLAGGTVAEALDLAGLGLAPGDEVAPAPDTPLVADMTIRLKRGVPFQLVVDGEEREVRANAATVGTALGLTGVAIGPEDYTEPGADTPLTAGLRVQLVRVRTAEESEEVEIPFGHQEQDDPEAELDTVTTVQAGQAGRKRLTRRVRYEDGQVTDRTTIGEETLSEPVEEIVKIGSKVVWHEVDTPQGPLRYWRKLRVYATSYSLSRSGTSPNAPWYGFTRSGMRMRRGIVAVDTRVVPLGTNLYVPSYGIGVAGDTGGGVRGFHVDLGFDDENYESWHSSVDLYLLEPLPPPARLRNLRRQ
jgi:uncharacterized protein YabE (DUF348 family)